MLLTPGFFTLENSDTNSKTVPEYYMRVNYRQSHNLALFLKVLLWGRAKGWQTSPLPQRKSRLKRKIRSLWTIKKNKAAELRSYGLSSDPLILLFPDLELAEDVQPSGGRQKHSSAEGTGMGEKWLAECGADPRIRMLIYMRIWNSVISHPPGQGRSTPQFHLGVLLH